MLTRRATLKAGSIGLGLGLAQLSALQSLSGASGKPKAKRVLFVFLTGGLSHHDSFDMKPDAPADIRGEFHPAATKTPGLQICEHLPKLAQLSQHFALLRSMQTASNGHGPACHMLLTGRLDFPAGFNLNAAPGPNEWPSIPAVATYALRKQRQGMPPAVVLPQPSVNEIGKVRPGQYAGKLGDQYDAWHIDIAAKCALGNGACPDCFRFDDDKFDHAANSIFETPILTLPEGGRIRFDGRLGLLQTIQRQQRELERSAAGLDRDRQQAISVLTDPKVSSAFNVERANPKTLERYGKNKFGLSLLMAKRLIEGGVNLVQVNLGKNSSWDTHRRNFLNLKNNLFPPFDRSLSALLEDLSASGLLEETLVIVTGEFGRTPKINKDGGRDHWGPVNTMLFAGGGVRGGSIVGESDRIGGEPKSYKQTPENFAATIYETLGIPRHGQWVDVDGRPHKIYHGAPISRLFR